MVKRTRSANDGRPWRCRCGYVNKPTQHRFFNLPAFQCGKCQSKLALDFKFCLGEIEAGGKSLIGEVYDQGNDPICVSFAYAKAAEVTERVFNINNGIDPDLVIPVDPYELEHRFMKKFSTGPSGVCRVKDPGLHKVLHMGLILRSEGIQRRVTENQVNNNDMIYKAADVSSIPCDAFEQICTAMAEGNPLVGTYLAGKKRGKVPYCTTYKSPSRDRIRSKNAKEIGHAGVLIGAKMEKGKRDYYLLSSWTERFCARRNKNGEIIRGGIVKIREEDLTKNVIKLSPPNESGGDRRLQDQSVLNISNVNFILMKGNEKQTKAKKLQELREEEAANGGYISADHFDDGIFRNDEGVHKFGRKQAFAAVKRPREQIADAEALLDLATSSATSVRSQSVLGITPSDFVAGLLKFGKQRGPDDEHAFLDWARVGCAASHVFMNAAECATMVGPMKTEVKLQRVCIKNKRTARRHGSARPEQLADPTEKTKSAIFNLLRRKKYARLEHLVLNRTSFAQTVGNVFALLFLVKDGRVKINVNDAGHHIVYPKNAPATSAVASGGEVFYNHFVSRFDFKDWKLMKGVVPEGEELMLHRSSQDAPSTAGNDHPEPELTVPTQSTLIRKRRRNHGLVLQDGTLAAGVQEIMSDRTAATGVQQVMEDEMPAVMGVKGDMEDETDAATGAKDVMGDKMVAKYRKEVNLMHKRRCLFQDG